ncbi:MAG TPA: hypothetical protein VJA17_04270, partial [Candidatus Omnitrophota bacterium]|nr:hypothetical protein [Candidatus Omnitrophota bacterium]
AVPVNAGGAISPAAVNTGDFIKGSAQTSVSYNRWGSMVIEAHDPNYPQKKGASEPITFKPGAIVIEAQAHPSGRNFYYVGESIALSVSAVDELKVPIPNYQGSIEISSPPELAVAEQYQFTETDAGKHIFITSASSAGFYTVSLEDKGSALKAESPKLEVKGAVLEVVSTFSPVGTTEVVIKLVDEQGNIIKSESSLALQVGLEEERDNSSASSSTFNAPATFQNGVAKILIGNTEAEVVTISPSSNFNFKVKKGAVTFGRAAKTGIGTLMWREIKK